MSLVDFQAGFNNDLRGQLMARAQAQFAAAKLAEEQRRTRFNEGMQEKTFKSNEELKHAQLDANTQARADATTQREREYGLKLNDQIQPGLIPDTPETARTIATLRAVGAGTDQAERPAIETGPLMPGDTGAAKPRGFLKVASANQANVIADNKRAEDQFTAGQDAKVEAARVAADNRKDEHEQNAKDRIAQIQAAAASRPKTDKLTKVEHKDPTTGRTVIEYLPESEIKGKSYEKGTGVAAEGRLASAQAVNQTGEDIIAKISDPAVAAQLGPTMGRYGSLREFVGNPPPELAELAGAIESYAIANMGVHGMRSVQGAEQIKKLLDKKHTPESLAATIRGLSQFSQHFMENEGRGPKGDGAKPAAGGDAGDPLGLRHK